MTENDPLLPIMRKRSGRSPHIEAHVHDPLYRCVQAERRLLYYSQTTLPKNIRTMSAGPQSPVLTFTKVPPTSAQPAI